MFQSLIGLCDVCDYQDICGREIYEFEFQSLIGLCDVCDLGSRSERRNLRFGFNP